MGLGEIGHVYAHHLAAAVYEGAAGVAGRDCCVRLDQVYQRGNLLAGAGYLRGDLPVEPADHTRRHGRLEPGWAADGNRELADRRRLIRLETGGGQVPAFGPDDGNICAGVAAYDLALHGGAIRQRNVDLFGSLNNVVVGDDVSILAVDNTAPQAALLLLLPKRRRLDVAYIYLHHAGLDLGRDPGYRLVRWYRRVCLGGGLGHVVLFRAGCWVLGAARHQQQSQDETRKHHVNFGPQTQLFRTSDKTLQRQIHYQIYTKKDGAGFTDARTRPALYPHAMDAQTNRKIVPADLARAGEARHFISWRAAIAGLGRGRLNDLAVATEAALTDIFLSVEDGTLEIESEHTEEVFSVSISHPELRERRMTDLPGILEHFLDGYELAPTRTTLTKLL